MNSVQAYEGFHDVGNESTTPTEDWDVANILREIEAAERHHQRVAEGLVHLPDGTVQVTEGMDLLHGIDHMERTAKRIASTTGPAIKHVKLSLTNEHYGYELTPLGEAIWMMCRNTTPLINQMYPACRKPARWPRERGLPKGMRPVFNPRITVLLHACQLTLSTLIWCTGTYPDLSQQATRRALEHVLSSVRRIFSSRRFKYLENNYQRNSKLRFEGACKYVADLFQEYSRLLILRVDLYFLPDHPEWADTDAAGRSIKAFMRALRDGRVVPNMLGSALRLENAPRRGIHAHLLVAMDGHLHREAATWSQILGETWVEKYSNGHGTYFNCYVRKDWFKFNGLGLVHISDVRKLIGVREALRYMTKPDFQIATGFTRNFRKGLPYRPEGAAKRGAPRKAEHDMRLMDRFLATPSSLSDLPALLG